MNLNFQCSLNLKKEKKMSSLIFLPFSKNTPNKIGNGIKVSGTNTLLKTENDDHWRIAIADEPIDAKVDGKKLFCVRVDNAEDYSCMMIGFTPMETFDLNTTACFGWNGFTGCGQPYARTGRAGCTAVRFSVRAVRPYGEKKKRPPVRPYGRGQFFTGNGRFFYESILFTFSKKIFLSTQKLQFHAESMVRQNFLRTFFTQRK